jgi:hypothetical protein
VLGGDARRVERGVALAHRLKKPVPELQLKLGGLADLPAGGLADGARDGIGLGDDVELGRDRGVADTPQLDLQREEADVGFLVQPVDDFPVLVRDLASNPDNDPGATVRGVDHQLPKMLVVGRVELVLDDDLNVLIAGDDVRAERADVLLGRDQFQAHPDGLAKQGQILVLSQPGREVSSLVLPVLP